MPEHVVCFVRIPLPKEKLDEVEAANREVLDVIITAATKYITRHVRATGEGEVIEVDEYASREDYDSFMVEVTPVLPRYEEMVGGKVTQEVFVVLDDESFEGDRWLNGEPLA